MSENILRAAKYRPTVKAGISSGAQGKAPRRATNASRPTPRTANIKTTKSDRPSNAFLRPSKARITNDAISSAYNRYVPRIYGQNIAAYSSKASSGFSVIGVR